MYREVTQPASSTYWARLNQVELNGVKVSQVPGGRGSGIIATKPLSEENAILMTIPQELLLSLDNVWIYAKADRHLREVFEAVGDYARTARGAILIFLLVQITSTSPDALARIGTSTAWTEYVKFLPNDFSLPTFWPDAERRLLDGTSLKAALDAKLKSLDREFTHLRDSTINLDWCKTWWDPDSGCLSFDDFKIVDAMYRSRALDLPGTGHAMVPYIDMANHASGKDTAALYDTDVNGNAILVLRDGKNLDLGEEVTITYGDEKGASEMLFSYGFLEEGLDNARELFLDIDIPEDDPLKLAKKSAFDLAPGFCLFLRDGMIRWEGPFVWLSCVNEEDGLGFRILQLNDGSQELAITWKGSNIEGILELEKCMQRDDMWDIFRLRAIALLQDRVRAQILECRNNNSYIMAVENGSESAIPQGVSVATRLANLEERLLIQAYEHFEQEKEQLMTSETVQKYLSVTSVDQAASPDEQDDFT